MIVLRLIHLILTLSLCAQLPITITISDQPAGVGMVWVVLTACDVGYSNQNTLHIYRYLI